MGDSQPKGDAAAEKVGLPRPGEPVGWGHNSLPHPALPASATGLVLLALTGSSRPRPQAPFLSNMLFCVGWGRGHRRCAVALKRRGLQELAPHAPAPGLMDICPPHCEEWEQALPF